MYGLDDTFLSARSGLRGVTICSLLIFAHVLLVTMAVAPRELIEAFPDLSPAVKVLSGLTFLTLLWKFFILFELADPAVARYSDQRSSTTAITPPIAGKKGEEFEGLGHVYTMAVSEIVLGTLVLAGWTYCLPSALTVFSILSGKVVIELALLPITYSLALGSILISHFQLIFQLFRIRRTRAAGTKLWTARTGYWAARVTLPETSVEKV